MPSRAAGPSIRTPTRTWRAETGAVTKSKIEIPSVQAVGAHRDGRNTRATRRTEGAPHGDAATGFENRFAVWCCRPIWSDDVSHFDDLALCQAKPRLDARIAYITRLLPSPHVAFLAVMGSQVSIGVVQVAKRLGHFVDRPPDKE
jgi:hypothetical protein